MDLNQIELYQRIQAFSLDPPDAQLTFSKRLARGNGWSISYACRVIDEYKRFVFLAVASGHPATPSDQVDQAWHLHLSYTRSYWQEFCPKVLQTPLHHDPTRGGSSEKLKLDAWYSKTLESYKHFFGQAPPIDIWPAPKDRFGRDLHFQRINTQQNWVLTKPNLKDIFQINLKQLAIRSVLVILSITVAGCQIITIIPNPLNFKGPDFLAFYISIIVFGIILASWLRFSLRLPDRAANYKSKDLSTYDIAFLSGGQNRVIVTAVTSLVQQGYLELTNPKQLLSRKKKLTPKKYIDNTLKPIERVVANHVLSAQGDIDTAILNPKDICNGIRKHLQQLGLIVNDKQASQATIYPSLVIISVLGLGICKLLVGIYRGKPVGFLIICIFFLFIAGSKFFVRPARSRYGDKVLQGLTTRSEHLKEGNKDDSTLPLAVALFGTAILAADVALADLHQMLDASRGDGDRRNGGPSFGGPGGGGDGGGGDGGGGGGGGGDGGGGGGCGGWGGG